MIRRIKKNKMHKMAKKHGINSFEYYKAGLDCYSRNDLIITTRDLAKQGIELSNRIEKAINKIQYIRDLGFDYDGFNNVEDLKGLIDDLVDLAGQSIGILNRE